MKMVKLTSMGNQPNELFNEKNMRIVFGLLILSMALLIGLGACKTQKTIKSEVGEIEVSVPFSSKEYQTDQDTFRAKQSGNSPDLSTSKKIALQNAKSELAGNIQIFVKSVTSQYTIQQTIAAKQDFENKFEELSIEVVNQNLSNVSIIGEKTVNERDGSYTYWVAIEMVKTSVLAEIDNKISKDPKLKADFDKKKFEEIFNKEMQSLQNEK